MKQLLAFGANVNHEDKDGHTALSKAFLNYHEVVMRLLLTSGAEVEDATMQLFLACSLGDLEAMKLILSQVGEVKEFVNTCKYGVSEYGISAALTNYSYLLLAIYQFHEETLLRRACNSNKTHVVQYLIDLGADVNMQYSVSTVRILILFVS